MTLATCPLTCITTPAACPPLTRVWMGSVTSSRVWILRCVLRTVTTMIKVRSKHWKCLKGHNIVSFDFYICIHLLKKTWFNGHLFMNESM